MEPIYCPEDNEYRIYCKFCDKLCLDRYYNNHLKSPTHFNNHRKKYYHLSRFLYFYSDFLSYINEHIYWKYLQRKCFYQDCREYKRSLKFIRWKEFKIETMLSTLSKHKNKSDIAYIDYSTNGEKNHNL